MESGKKNFVVSVYSPSGGQGTTFVACQLLNNLLKSSPCLLLDLNLDFPVSLHYLNQDPQSAFRASALSNSESTTLSSFAAKVKDNYYAVGTPLVGYGQFAEDSLGAMKELLDMCRAEFEFTVIDLPHPLHVDITRIALSMSDLVLVVCGNNPHAAASCTKFRKMLASQSLSSVSAKVEFVLNSNYAQNAARNSITTTALFSSLIIAMVIAFNSQISGSHTDPSLLGLLMLVLIGLLLSTLHALVLGLLSNSSRGKNSAAAILAENQILVFQLIPNDSKASRWAINMGQFLDNKLRIAKAFSELATKIREKLKA